MCVSWDGKQCWPWVFHPLRTENPFTIFPVPRSVFFVKQLPRMCCKTGPTHFSSIVDNILCRIHQLVSSQKLSGHPWRNRQITADSAGSGSNLNYSSIIVCSWFSPKIIFRHKTCYFKWDPLRVLQDSPPSYVCSCPLFWPLLESSPKEFKKMKKIWNIRIPSFYVT